MKAGLAQMLKGGIIMDVVSADQARIAEEAGVCAGIVCVNIVGATNVVLFGSTIPSQCRGRACLHTCGDYRSVCLYSFATSSGPAASSANR